MSRDSNIKHNSKFLSYVLRHHPETIGLKMDKHGWVEVSELIRKARKQCKSLDLQTIRTIIQNSGKQRFILSEDEQFIRAGYGHSVDIDLQLHPKKPPETLYHGTAQQNVGSILEEGILSSGRNFVHLSATEEEAQKVGGRHGKPVILLVRAETMCGEGYNFYQSDSEADIWLVQFVPAEFVETQNGFSART